MKVTKFPKKINNSKKTMLLGSFFTFHNGHKMLLEVARTYKNKVSLLLIDNLDILNKDSKKNFESLDIRLQHMANIGIDEVIVLEFNEEIANMEGSVFAQKLVDTYNVKKFVVGKDFSMGKGAKYTSKDLQKDHPTTIVKTQKINDKKISTSVFREFVEFGDVSLVKENSEFYFTIDVRVNNNNNFEIDGLTPHAGIYAAWAIVNSIKYWSVVRVSSTKKHEILIPELRVKNTSVDVQIEFASKIRSIIRKDFDSITEEDSNKAIMYLKNTI